MPAKSRQRPVSQRPDLEIRGEISAVAFNQKSKFDGKNYEETIRFIFNHFAAANARRANEAAGLNSRDGD